MPRIIDLAIKRVMSNPASLLKIVSPKSWGALITAANDTGAKPRKKEAREKAFHEGTRWAHETEISKRQYQSYDEYLEHQREKLEIISPRLQTKEDQAFENFKNRFAVCPEMSGITLCLGARLGTEVRALHSLGRFSIGIDLNPGPDNKFVLPGDFHALQFPNASIDCCYTNSMDHIFDMTKFMGEVRRVLKPTGHFVADVVLGYEEGFVAGDYEATFWPKVRPFLNSVADAHGFRIVRCETIESEPLWVQCVMALKS